MLSPIIVPNYGTILMQILPPAELYSGLKKSVSSYILQFTAEVSSLVKGSLRIHAIFFDLQRLSLVGNTWPQCCLPGR